jgi:hypothetical protein
VKGGEEGTFYRDFFLVSLRQNYHYSIILLKTAFDCNTLLVGNDVDNLKKSSFCIHSNISSSHLRPAKVRSLVNDTIPGERFLYNSSFV